MIDMHISMRSSIGGISGGAFRATAAARRKCHVHANSRKNTVVFASLDKRGSGHVVRYRAETTTQADAVEELTIELPLECQQLLGFPPGSLPKISEVSLAFQELVDIPLMTGYSSFASEARHELLLIAKSDLVASQQQTNAGVNRGASGQQARLGASIDIPLDLVPGALVILAEIGENDKTLALGRELLSTPDLFASPGTSSSPPGSSSLLPWTAKCDIALSMALAHCSLAGLALEDSASEGPQEGQGSTMVMGIKSTMACIHLQDALHLLEDNPPTSTLTPSGSSKGSPWGGRGPVNPPQVLAPDLVREIKESLMNLRAPCILGELTSTLSPNPKPNGTGSQQERRKRALRSLREILKEETSVLSSSPSSLLPFQNFSHQATVNPSQAAKKLDASMVKQMMSALTCEEIVHLAEWEQVVKQGPSVHTWLYPGLSTLVATGHLITGFNQRQPSYVKIALLILKQQGVGGGRDGQSLVAASVCQLLLGQVAPAVALIKEAQAVKGVGSSQSSSWEGVSAYSFVVEHSPEGGEGEDGLLPGLCAFAEQWMTQAAFPLFPDTAMSTRTPSLSGYFDDSKVEALIAVYDESKSVSQSSEAGGMIGSRASMLAAELAAAASGVQSALLSRATGSAEIDANVTDTLASLSEPIKRYGLAVIGVLAALGAIGASSTSYPSATQGRQQTMAAAWVMSRNSEVAAVMDRDAAHKLIKAWQNVKQSCLGPDHDVSSLSSILTGQALSEARQRTTSFKEKGYAMKYRLYQCEIKEIARSAGSVTVRALLDESASVIDKAGKATADYHRSSYEATYQVTNVAKNGQEQWRISKILVSKGNEH